MQRRLDGLPEWMVKIDEISGGVYNLVAENRLGPRIEIEGADPGDLFEPAKMEARDIEREIARSAGHGLREL
jgi:hypothetical protein